MSAVATLDQVWAALAEVADPEIPPLSVVDLGVIRSVTIDDGCLRVELLPTFVGCPAIDVMTKRVHERLEGMASRVEVTVSFAEPWTSERITPAGRRHLRESGFAPPLGAQPKREALFGTIPVLVAGPCPYCGSRDTELISPFGPTLCRAISRCRSCLQPFEQFKTV